MNELNLLQLRKSLKMTQLEFCDKFEISQSYLSEIENRKKPLTIDLYNNIVIEFGQHIIDKVIVEPKELKSQSKEILISESDIKENIFTGTPVYDIDGTCGTDERDMQFADDSIIGSVNLPGISKSAKIITANGDSMEPVIHDGSRVVLREIFGWDDIFYGQIYLILMEEYRMIKYIRRYEKDEENYVILRSENPKYDDMRIHKDKIRKLFIVENILSVKNQI